MYNMTCDGRGVKENGVHRVILCWEDRQTYVCSGVLRVTYFVVLQACFFCFEV